MRLLELAGGGGLLLLILLSAMIVLRRRKRRRRDEPAPVWSEAVVADAILGHTSPGSAIELVESLDVPAGDATVEGVPAADPSVTAATTRVPAAGTRTVVVPLPVLCGQPPAERTGRRPRKPPPWPSVTGELPLI